MDGLLILICAGFGFFCEPDFISSKPEVAPVITAAPPEIQASAISSQPDYSGISVRCLMYREQIQAVTDEPAWVAAQLEQESGCRPFAKSKYAHGLMQFTPATAKWAGDTICADLGEVDLYSPEWSIGCGVKYMTYLLGKNADVSPLIDRWGVAARGYNGGQGYIDHEKRLANPPFNYDKIAAECRNTGRRAGWACDENLGYVPHILRRKPKYEGYGGSL